MMRVMLVDDEPYIHDLMARKVRWARHGYAPLIHAEGGSQALDALRSPGARFDVLLTDLNMPGMDGFALIREAASAFPDLAIVVLSVYNDSGNIREAFRLGATDYMLKYEIEEAYVIETIARALKVKRGAPFLDGEPGAALEPSAPPDAQEAAAALCEAVLKGEDGARLVQSWQRAFLCWRGAEREAVLDFYLRVLYMTEARMVGYGLPEEELARLLAGDAVLACAVLSQVTEHMASVGAALSALVARAERGRNERLIGQAVEWIDRHIGESLTLTRAAERVGLNASYFSRLFQATRGQSFSSYLTERRLDAAKRLLIQSPGAKIYEVACRCGFSSVEHFSRSFKKRVGVSPIRYRFTHEKSTSDQKGEP